MIGSWNIYKLPFCLGPGTEPSCCGTHWNVAGLRQFQKSIYWSLKTEFQFWYVLLLQGVHVSGEKISSPQFWSLFKADRTSVALVKQRNTLIIKKHKIRTPSCNVFILHMGWILFGEEIIKTNNAEHHLLSKSCDRQCSYFHSLNVVLRNALGSHRMTQVNLCS